MKTSNMLAATVIAASMLTLAQTASAAAPTALLGAGQALTPKTGTAVEPIDYRCWWTGHRRVCGWVRPTPRLGFYWAPPRRHFYGYGRGYGAPFSYRRYGW
jgi:hypothetical protein